MSRIGQHLVGDGIVDRLVPGGWSRFTVSKLGQREVDGDRERVWNATPQKAKQEEDKVKWKSNRIGPSGIKGGDRTLE